MTTLVKDALVAQLSKYCKNFDQKSLSVSMFAGDVNLSNLELNVELFQFMLGIPASIRLTRAVCNKLKAKVSWTQLTSSPIVVYIDTLTIQLEEAGEDSPPLVPPPELDAVNAPPAKYGTIDKVIDGLAFEIGTIRVTTRLHRHAEDTEPPPVLSLVFSGIRIFSCDSMWKFGKLDDTRTQHEGSIFHNKIMQFNSIALGVNSAVTSDGPNWQLDKLEIRLVIKKRIEPVTGPTSVRTHIRLPVIDWGISTAHAVILASYLSALLRLLKKDGALDPLPPPPPKQIVVETPEIDTSDPIAVWKALEDGTLPPLNRRASASKGGVYQSPPVTEPSRDDGDTGDGPPRPPPSVLSASLSLYESAPDDVAESTPPPSSSSSSSSAPAAPPKSGGGAAVLYKDAEKYEEGYEKRHYEELLMASAAPPYTTRNPAPFTCVFVTMPTAFFSLWEEKDRVLQRTFLCHLGALTAYWAPDRCDPLPGVDVPLNVPVDTIFELELDGLRLSQTCPSPSKHPSYLHMIDSWHPPAPGSRHLHLPPLPLVPVPDAPRKSPHPPFLQLVYSSVTARPPPPPSAPATSTAATAASYSTAPTAAPQSSTVASGGGGGATPPLAELRANVVAHINPVQIVYDREALEEAVGFFYETGLASLSQKASPPSQSSPASAPTTSTLPSVSSSPATARTGKEEATIDSASPAAASSASPLPPSPKLLFNVEVRDMAVVLPPWANYSGPKELSNQVLTLTVPYASIATGERALLVHDSLKAPSSLALLEGDVFPGSARDLASPSVWATHQAATTRGRSHYRGVVVVGISMARSPRGLRTPVLHPVTLLVSSTRLDDDGGAFVHSPTEWVAVHVSRVEVTLWPTQLTYLLSVPVHRIGFDVSRFKGAKTEKAAAASAAAAAADGGGGGGGGVGKGKEEQEQQDVEGDRGKSEGEAAKVASSNAPPKSKGRPKVAFSAVYVEGLVLVIASSALSPSALPTTASAVPLLALTDAAAISTLLTDPSSPSSVALSLVSRGTQWESQSSSTNVAAPSAGSGRAGSQSSRAGSTSSLGGGASGGGGSSNSSNNQNSGSSSSSGGGGGGDSQSGRTRAPSITTNKPLPPLPPRADGSEKKTFSLSEMRDKATSSIKTVASAATTAANTLRSSPKGDDLGLTDSWADAGTDGGSSSSTSSGGGGGQKASPSRGGGGSGSSLLRTAPLPPTPPAKTTHAAPSTPVPTASGAGVGGGSVGPSTSGSGAGGEGGLAGGTVEGASSTSDGAPASDGQASPPQSESDRAKSSQEDKDKDKDKGEVSDSDSKGGGGGGGGAREASSQGLDKVSGEGSSLSSSSPTPSQPSAPLLLLSLLIAGVELVHESHGDGRSVVKARVGHVLSNPTVADLTARRHVDDDEAAAAAAAPSSLPSVPKHVVSLRYSARDKEAEQLYGASTLATAGLLPPPAHEANSWVDLRVSKLGLTLDSRNLSALQGLLVVPPELAALFVTEPDPEFGINASVHDSEVCLVSEVKGARVVSPYVISSVSYSTTWSESRGSMLSVLGTPAASSVLMPLEAAALRQALEDASARAVLAADRAAAAGAAARALEERLAATTEREEALKREVAEKNAQLQALMEKLSAASAAASAAAAAAPATS